MSFKLLPANHYRITCISIAWQMNLTVPRRVAHDIAMIIDPFKRPTAFQKELRNAYLVYAAANLTPSWTRVENSTGPRDSNAQESETRRYPRSAA